MKRFFYSSSTKFLLLLMFMFLTINSFLFSQVNLDKELNYELITKRLTDGALTNLTIGLNSDNDGIRMDCVNIIGKYKITQREEKLIEMLNDESIIENKASVAIALFQLGTYNSIIALKNYQSTDEDSQIKNLCDRLVDEYNKDQITKSYLVFEIEKTMVLNNYIKSK